MNLFRSFFTVSAYTMLSRILGLFRDIIFAAYLGAGALADAFFVAFRFPNFFRALFAEGAFSAAFVPKFSEILTRQGRQQAHLFAEQAMAWMILVVSLFVLMAEGLMPYFVHLIAPGFGDDPEQFALAVDLSRLTFPYLLLMSLVALYGGVLNALDRFSAFASAPVIMNLVMMVAIVSLAPFLDSPSYAAAIGVLLSGIAQLIWMIYAAHKIDVRLRPRRPIVNDDMRALLKAMLPAALGSGVLQVNLLIGVMLASLLPDGSVSYLYYADRLFQLPLGVVGIAIATALLPILSKNISAGDQVKAMYHQNRAIEVTMLLTLPAAMALVVMPLPILHTLFVRAEFSALDAQQTAFALSAFALALPAVVLVRALTPNFFARGDTSTPLRAAFISVAVNCIANILLMGLLDHVGIALGTAIASWVNVWLLLRILKQKDFIAFDTQLKQRLPRMVGSSVLMGIVLLFTASILGNWLYGENGLLQFFGLILLVLIGFAAYAATALLLKAANLGEIKQLFQKTATSAKE